MKIAHIHRAIRFRQADFLAPYISYNNDLRKRTVTTIGKSIPKLMNNSICGRTLYNHRNTKNFKLVYTEEAFDRNSKKITVKSIKLLDENVALFHHQKNEVHAKFPCIIGSAILDLSKLHMYQSYYEGFKSHIKDVHIMYMDTDSFVLYSRSPNFIEEMKTMKQEYLDCSNLPSNHPLNYEPNNANVLGKFKDETAGVPITEAVFLRPKLYSLKRADGEGVRRAKGVKRYVISQELHHEEYLNILRASGELYCLQRSIRARDFVNYTVEVRKKTLSSFCDKRFQINSVQSVPYGYEGPPLPPPSSDLYE